MQNQGQSQLGSIGDPHKSTKSSMRKRALTSERNNKFSRTGFPKNALLGNGLLLT
jgi:hypothetical protein